jgi:hypothetical protein
LQIDQTPLLGLPAVVPNGNFQTPPTDTIAQPWTANNDGGGAAYDTTVGHGDQTSLRLDEVSNDGLWHYPNWTARLS